MTQAVRPPKATDEARDTDFVQSLQRGLAVIHAFDAEHPALTLSEVARATGLARAAARRFLLTLVELGYMRVEDKRFRLTPRVLELGHAYLSSLTLPEIALPHMREFVAEVRESSSLCVLDEDQIVYVARVPAKRIMSVSISVGTRFPGVRDLAGSGTPRRANGRMAAGVPRRGRVDSRSRRIRSRRRSCSPRRSSACAHRAGLPSTRSSRRVCAPSPPRFTTPAGEVAAGINVSAHASRWTVEEIQETLLPRLLATAAQIDREARSAVSG